MFSLMQISSPSPAPAPPHRPRRLTVAWVAPPVSASPHTTPAATHVTPAAMVGLLAAMRSDAKLWPYVVRSDFAALDGKSGAFTAILPPPPKPAIRRGVTRISGDNPEYPRAAMREGINKGRVVARMNIDEKGNVTEVIIFASEPPRVFDKVVRAALEGWKFKAEGERYVGEVEINFSLKDE
jgi:TonB family protein